MRDKIRAEDSTDQAGPIGAVQVIEHLWIPMPDGVRLAARLWRPESALDVPVPALLEYIPYRKADMVRARDERNHPWFAAHGFACLRVDMRGSGDSEGVMTDMYTDLELSDARSVIDWIAQQPWCSGAVGMFGTSWGGTAALQASQDPPDALRAVIAVCATHDRYEDDIHYMGGCVLTDTLEWGATMPAILAAPPTPEIGPDWKAMWETRLKHLSYPVETWLREATRGTYWRRGSVIHAPERLSVPILAIGGWSDRYSNSVMSLAAARPDLVWGVVGPWGHHYPDHGHPGPTMGFQSLALDWWRHWLGASPSPLDWPKLRIWVREHEPPRDVIETRKGAWMDASTSVTSTEPLVLSLERNCTTRADRSFGVWKVPFDLNVGTAAGDTGYFGRTGGLPLDQSPDDARSLCFETPALEHDRVILGSASLCLALARFGEMSQLTGRLVDVATDGSAMLITRAVRALVLDDALENALGVPQSGDRKVTIAFPTCAYRLRTGHRLRISFSASYWPLIWPAPDAEDIRIRSGKLKIPVCVNGPGRLARPLPGALDLPAQKSFDVVRAPSLKRETARRPDGRRIESWHQPLVSLYYRETGTTFSHESRADCEIHPGNALSATSRHSHRACYQRDDGAAEIESTLTMSANVSDFLFDGQLKVRWNDETVAKRSWSGAVARQGGLGRT